MIHRMVDRNIAGYKFGDIACGAESGNTSMLPSGYNCDKCRDVMSGLQLLDRLYFVFEHLDDLPVSPEIKSALSDIHDALVG